MQVHWAMPVFCIVMFGGAGGAWGHGIGAETLPPQPLGDGMVVMQVEAGFGEEAATQRFALELQDLETGQAVGDLSVGVRALKGGSVLFDDVFESSTGRLEIDMVYGTEAGAVEKGGGIFGFVLGGIDTASVTGPHYNRGGLYQVFITVYGAGGVKPGTPLFWEAGISIPDTTIHRIQDPNFGVQEMRHISYYDIIEDFEYDPQARRISFEMPVDSRQESINQTSVIHEEVAFSNLFGDLMVSEMSLQVDGLAMGNDTIQIDDFMKGERIVHITIYGDGLAALSESGRLDDGMLRFVLEPAGPGLPYSMVTDNGQFRIVVHVSPAHPQGGGEMHVSHKIFDVFLKDRPVSVEHVVTVTADGERIGGRIGPGDGSHEWTDNMTVAIPAGAQLLTVYFEDLAGNGLARAMLPIIPDRMDAIPPVVPAPTAGDAHVPGWVRTVAGLWADGMISDAEFVAGIEFLIREGVMDASGDAQQGGFGGIPGWVRTVAGLWADGMISDAEFVAGIEFLIAVGIVAV